jgi:integrase
MRPVEVKHLRRRDVDLFQKLVTVRRSKNEFSHRVIPLNAPALKALGHMIERADALGFTSPDHYLWFACQWNKLDPTQPTRQWDTAWRALRKKADLPGLRFHDLRRTFITEMMEHGVPDRVLKSLVGHVTERMLEHYSHIRMAAKREAVDALQTRWNQDQKNAEEKNNAEVVQ